MINLVALLADGSLVVILIAAAICGMVWYRHASWRERSHTIPIVIMSGLTSLLVGKLLSLLYQPAASRPFIEKGVEAGAAFINNPGFPSDHALLATIVVMTVWMVTKYHKVALVLAGLVVVMSVARVVALVHTPLDVVGGVAAGLSGAVWYRKRK